MAYTISTPLVGAQPIAVTDTTQNHAVGTIVRGVDPTYGEAEFIYLKGVASTAVGDLVVIDQGTTARTGTSSRGPVGIAMSANVASPYGWYQISGRAVAAKTSGLALASNAAVGVLTAGKIAATGSGKEVQGALTIAKSTASTTVSLVISRPHMQGRIS